MSNTTIPLPVLAVVAFAATRFPVPSNPTPSTPPGDPRFDAHLDVVDRGDAGIVVTVPCDDAGCDFCAVRNVTVGMLPPPAPRRRPPVRVSRGVVLPAPIGAEVA